MYRCFLVSFLFTEVVDDCCINLPLRMIKFLHRLNALGDAHPSGLNSKLRLNHVVRQRGVESIPTGIT